MTYEQEHSVCTGMGNTRKIMTNKAILDTLLHEGVITEYNINEKWYKPSHIDKAVKRRWQEIIDSEVERITSIFI